MKHLSKKIRIASLVTLGILLTAGLSIYFYFFAPLSRPLQGQLSLPCLRHPVNVTRDSFGIPHIEAQNRPDLFCALGFVMSSDRLFQMDLNRRVGNGELSEIFGEKLLPADQLFRNLRFRSSMRDLLQNKKSAMSPEIFQLGESFLQGVNEFATTQKLPVEFTILGYRPKKFELLDLFSFSGYMSFSFAEGITADLLFGELQKTLSPEKWLALSTHEQAPNAGAQAVSAGQASLFYALKETMSPFAALDGSNSWVLSPKKSHSGKAILANDPHIAFSLPGVWYEAHLKAPDYEVYGHFLPLIPFPLLGHNRQRGWAVTMSEIDDMDFYRETLHPTDPHLVRYRGQWVPLQEEVETIKVKGKEDVVMTVRRSPHGPLLDKKAFMPNSQKVYVDGVQGDLAVKWTFYHPENLTIQSFYELPLARTMDEFSRSLGLIKAPGLNISYADAEGNIAWWVVGAIPARPQGVRGDTVLDGESGKDEYRGYLPFAKNPRLINPPSGVIVSANYIPPTLLDHSADFPVSPIPGYFRPEERYQFLWQKLNASEKWNLEDLKNLQTAQEEISLAEVLPILLEEMKTHESALNDEEKQVYQTLSQWKGDSSPENRAAAFYHFWNEEIFRLMVEDEMNEGQILAYCSLSYMWPFYKKTLGEKDSLWWDNLKTTAEKETRNQIVLGAWKKTWDIMKEKGGSDPSLWTWGKFHQLEFIHPLGRVPPLNKIFNVGPHPVGGGYLQINCMQPSHCKRNFNVMSGPSTRRLIDFAHPEKSWGILPLGINGNAGNIHFQDQLKIYLKGEYRPQLMDWETIHQEKSSHLVLEPHDTI